MISLLSILLIFLSPMSEPIRTKPTKAENCVDRILQESTELIEQKIGLRTFGTGAAMPGGDVQKFHLAFQIETPRARESLRKTLIDAANVLLSVINKDEEVQPFLTKRPFDINNVQIEIFLSDSRGDSLYDPFIAVASLSEGILTYKTFDKDDELKSKYKETYEEALQKLN